MDDSKGDKSIISLSLRSKLKQLRFIGRMIGFAVYQNLLLNLQLSKPFVKQILGIPLSHPDDLSSFDYELHKNAVVWVRENSVDQLELPFSVDAINPWNSKLVTIELSNDVDRKLTDNNKEEYAKLVSQLKLETLVKEEVAEFAGGLNEVIPRELLSLFTADEFSLLIGGVAKIDVSDWKSNTKYDGWSSTDDEISWFWGVVSQLKEEEKALLLKFSTGSPCVPIGGFASLTGLGGATRFTVLKIEDVNKIPMASTCFNMLKLSRYSSEKHLKDKLLIAIRHGAEGFSFS
ncbi:E3 ubiquitin-protein ligase HACE1-like [Acropora millepora]|nr:E3 ubiquitin-protein ligase HACE1-like [Acropora millepora]